MNAKNHGHHTYVAIAGHAVFGVMTIMALWFWQERTLILDAAFQGYLFIAKGQPAIMVERFGAAAVQLLPLLGVWTGASLKTVLVLYSVSFVLLQWSFFSVCLHFFKDSKVALAILLFNILLMGDSFYWIQNELLQAIGWMFLLGAMWRNWANWRNWKALQQGASLLLMVMIVYLHPLVVFPLAFIWCYCWIEKRPSPKELVGVALAFALIFASKYVLRQPNFYDRGMIGQFAREFDFSWQKLLTAESFQDFLRHCGDNFMLFFPVTILVIVFFGKTRQWLKIALVLGFTGIYCLLIMQRFLRDDRWYIQESHYQVLAVFLLVPLVWDILPVISGKKWLPYLCAGLLLVRISSIYLTHETYTERLAYVHQWLEKARSANTRKMVVSEVDADRNILMMTWGLPFETLQMSALESPDSACVVVVSKPGAEAAAQYPRDSMVSFLMIPSLAFRDLPQNYYRIPDSSVFKAAPVK